MTRGYDVRRDKGEMRLGNLHTHVHGLFAFLWLLSSLSLSRYLFLFI